MKNGWIKAEDALPPKRNDFHRSKLVLVHFIGHEGDDTWEGHELIRYDYEDEEWRFPFEYYETDWMSPNPKEKTYEVTHWMPIPPIEDV